MHDELMCWLGVDRDGVQIRYFEPVKMRNGTSWAYVPREFAELAVRAWDTARYEASW